MVIKKQFPLKFKDWTLKKKSVKNTIKHKIKPLALHRTTFSPEKKNNEIGQKCQKRISICTV